MITKKLKELAVAKAKLVLLEKDLASGLKKELAELPARYGFRDARSFVKAVKGASSSSPGGSESNQGGRRRRAMITEEIRLQVKRLVNEGKTGAVIASEVGISLPSVQNIKKALGLVKARKA